MENRNHHSLIVKEGPSRGNSFDLEQAELVIGREVGVEILIESPGISRRHARLSLQNDVYTIEDLGSSNGTFVNGERLSAPRRLKHGDQIRLGQTVGLEYQAPQPAKPAADATMLEGRPLPANQTMLEGAALRPDSTMLEGAAARPGQTMIGDSPSFVPPSAPPQLIVTIAGATVHTYSLTQPRINLGRADDNQIVIQSQIVSRYHATLERRKDGYQISVLEEAGNPLLIEGRPLTQPRLLRHGDTLRIGSQDPGSMVTLTYLDPQRIVESQPKLIEFGQKSLLSIGRDPGNDIVLDSPNISRFHAQIERVGQRYRLVDLQSANGVFVNDQRITASTWLQPNDAIRIGRHRLVMGADAVGQIDDLNGLSIDALNLNKWVRKDLNILKNISLAFKPREFIVVVGQSGGGKSTLVDAIAGYRPATHGMVLVNGVNIYKNFEVVINDIGYVPQRDIIHYELTVYQALDYAARLRMPGDTSKEERHKRIMEVLADLDLVERKDLSISRLSGGQIKRVSIGVELLTKPSLFYLDEPTSGLDPGTETAFMHLMRRLADQGRTIVMVTHATKNVMLADKVVFLARGGYLAWFGPPDEALKYFDAYRSERERRAREMDFDQIYAILDDSSKGSAQEWAQRFIEHNAYQKFIVQPLQAHQGNLVIGGVTQPDARAARPKAKRSRRASALRQFFVLSARNLKILTRDRTSLVLMLAAPLLIAAIDFILAPLLGRSLLGYATGDAANASTTWFLLAIDGLLVGGFSQMREFTKEADIYKRERLVNLKIFPYVASKVWIAALLSLYQAAAFTIVRWVSFDIPGGQQTLMLIYVTMVLAVLAGMMSGLLASAFAPNASSAPLLMILLIVPQIVLSGALAPIPSAISSIASTRWAFQGLMGLAGIGSDVAGDVCWQLPTELREAMTLDDKTQQGCRCMGLAMFTPGSCNFPGLGAYYEPEVDQAAPIEPPPLADRPAEPVIPPAPQAPADQNDQVAMVKYMNSLQTYQDEVTQIQNQYRDQMKLYESQADVYKAQMEAYQKDRLAYEAGRSTAVNSAETLIKSVKEEFGWTFVDKNNPDVFWPWILKSWGAQLVIIGAYFILILIIFKRKDAK